MKSVVFGIVAQNFHSRLRGRFVDWSAVSTIALTAGAESFERGIGSCAAHTITATCAVAGGAILSHYISDSAIGFVGWRAVSCFLF